MIISYENDTIIAQCASPAEKEACDYIFGRADGIGIVSFHLSAFLNQRMVQKNSEDATIIFSAFKALPEKDKQDILAKLKVKQNG